MKQAVEHDHNIICKGRLSWIVRVNVVLNRTVLVDSDWCFDNLCGSHLQSQSELYHVSWWYYTLVIDLIGQLRRDYIGRLSVKPWCYWLWRLVISNWCVSIRLLSHLNSRLLLVKLLVKLSFSHRSSKTNYERMTIWLTIGCRNVSHCEQQQSYSGLRSPRRSNSTFKFHKCSCYSVICSALIQSFLCHQVLQIWNNGLQSSQSGWDQWVVTHTLSHSKC